jgi:hypothetical protein
MLVDARHENIHRVHEGSVTACAIGGGLAMAWAEGSQMMKTENRCWGVV